MKRIVFLLLLCIVIFSGCSTNSNNKLSNSNYNAGYDEGYADGYNDALEKSLNNSDYSDELHSFQSAISNLMYDHEYDTVRKLLEYNRRGVETALENEFGSQNIDDVIEYLDALSKTIIGTCEICGEPVYADEFAILPEGISCAHSKCISKNSNKKTFEIQKDS